MLNGSLGVTGHKGTSRSPLPPPQEAAPVGNFFSQHFPLLLENEIKNYLLKTQCLSQIKLVLILAERSALREHRDKASKNHQ